MITLDSVKTYLRIDGDAEDNMLRDYIKSADIYMHTSIECFDELQQKAIQENSNLVSLIDLCKMMLIAEWYEFRTQQSRPDNSAISYMMTKLQTQGMLLAKEIELQKEAENNED